MKPLDLGSVYAYVDTHIANFHEQRLKSLASFNLDKLMEKNLYLPAMKREVGLAHKIVENLLREYLSTIEEKHFGDFLEGLAVFIAGETCDGHKSAAQGVDLEFINKNVHYIVSIKSGPNWGNSSQHKTLAQDFQNAVTCVRQTGSGLQIEPVLGICYGKTRTNRIRDGYLKVVGQNFWYLISENRDLYTNIIEPIGYYTEQYAEDFSNEHGRVMNLITKEFIDRFCDDGEIKWVKLVEFNSGNYDLDEFLP